MDEDAKKTALRMIPYGMYVRTSKSEDGKDVSAPTVNWPPRHRSRLLWFWLPVKKTE